MDTMSKQLKEVLFEDMYEDEVLEKMKNKASLKRLSKVNDFNLYIEDDSPISLEELGLDPSAIGSDWD